MLSQDEPRAIALMLVLSLLVVAALCALVTTVLPQGSRIAQVTNAQDGTDASSLFTPKLTASNMQACSGWL